MYRRATNNKELDSGDDIDDGVVDVVVGVIVVHDNFAGGDKATRGDRGRVVGGGGGGGGSDEKIDVVLLFGVVAVVVVLVGGVFNGTGVGGPVRERGGGGGGGGGNEEGIPTDPPPTPLRSTLAVAVAADAAEADVAAHPNPPTPLVGALSRTGSSPNDVS